MSRSGMSRLQLVCLEAPLAQEEPRIIPQMSPLVRVFYEEEEHRNTLFREVLTFEILRILKSLDPTLLTIPLQTSLG